MSESSDDARIQAEEGAPPPPAVDASSDDDVEVMAQAPEEPPAPRHDSVAPTSRKLAPPPKPKRDSANPGSVPPSAGDVSVNLGSIKAPSMPAISYQDAGASSREAVAAALASSESLRSIGEALSKDAGAFSTNEAATGGGRPAVPRPRSSPQLAPAGDAPLSAGPETRPSRSPSEPPRPRDKTPTVPDDVPAPLSAAPSSAVPKSGGIFAQRIIAVGTPSSPPPAPSSPPAAAAPPPPAAHVDLDRTLDAASDDAPPDIPITTELDDEAPTAPTASAQPLEAPPPPLPSAPVIPAEPTPPPPAFVAAEAKAEALAPEEAAPDSVDRMPVEELSREDSPSIPPEEATPMMPPPAPSARVEAKQPPPPPKRAPAPPPREETAAPDGEKKKAKQKRPWWEELFSEDFVRANWKVSDEQIKREVTFVEESLGVAPGGVVLDLGCGSGQHAVELASRGYGVVGYDLSLYQLALAADIAQERSQKINFLQGDMREMAFEEMFDGIFCWNTTFGYFEEDKNCSVAERAFRALRPGGMFLVDVINRDFVAAHTPSSMWFEGDSCVCMDDAVIDYFTSRLRVKRSVILDDGRTRECTYSVRLYSFHELGKLLHEVGFRVTEVSGHPATPGVFLGQASPRILMLAQRP
ncbi:MAG TPA: methyltransferase domain-containing protein [Polyangiaceae bacterium]|nr:methyltransferase domain-containing protein [Polyangiaceae bacterium]